MSRKPKKGYYVKGEFVAEGSERDLELKAELKGTTDATRTDLKKESDALQALGEALLTLTASRIKALTLPEALLGALAEYQRITQFEARRRQMQFIGKLMRRLDEQEIAAIRAALDDQRASPALEQTHLHIAEQWRERLVASDNALTDWLAQCPTTDTQQLRALIRQCRKDDAAAQARAEAARATGQLPKALPKSRAWKDLFQIVRQQLQTAHHAAVPSTNHT